MSKLTEIRSRCGFCNTTFQVWSERNDHLAEHFRNGASMKDWMGARGLEPTIAAQVRHSIPPYLISTESTALVPFSAEYGVSEYATHEGEHSAVKDLNSSAPSPFENLVSELGRYVIAQKSQHLVPSDHALQQKARLIVYGEDDPWNQTAADNSQWLDLFKDGYGIGTHASSTTGQTELSLPVDSDMTLDEALNLPWYWQSPECLAKYRENKAAFLASHGLSTLVISDTPQANHTLDHSTIAHSANSTGPRAVQCEHAIHPEQKSCNDCQEQCTWNTFATGHSHGHDESLLLQDLHASGTRGPPSPSFTEECDTLISSLDLGSHDLLDWT